MVTKDGDTGGMAVWKDAPSATQMLSWLVYSCVCRWLDSDSMLEAKRLYPATKTIFGPHTFLTAGIMALNVTPTSATSSITGVVPGSNHTLHYHYEGQNYKKG